MTADLSQHDLFDDSSASPTGLSSSEAARRLAEVGPNEVVESPEHPLRRTLRHFWSPVPWMLEVTIQLQLAASERLEAMMVAALLLINVGLAMAQEGRASATLALLRRRLAPRARVRRGGAWLDVAAAVLVPGDVVQLSLGGIVRADARLLSGSLTLDQSMLTGESVAVEREAGGQAYAGALVRRGEALAEVTATGARTYFGRAAELVRSADVESSEQQAVLSVVKALTIVNMTIVIGMVAYARAIGMTLPQIIPLVLAALLSAVPVAFTVAATLGARRLANEGVLLAKLSALQEAAMIDVLCVDKTGTLTMNSLGVARVAPLMDAFTEAMVPAYAAASSTDSRDPVDAAIRAAAAQRDEPALPVIRFTPFDPAAKMAEAVVAGLNRTTTRIAKGSPIAIAALAPQDYAIYAGVFPEDKFRLVKAFQRQGHAVGMCGDGANDAPALRQAQMGIAVSSATDVAKSAAGLVLTQPRLKGILACIEEGRAAFRRVLTFTLSMLVNKAVTLIVMGVGLVMTGHAVMTPLLQALWMLGSDIPMMARAADRAKPTPYPNAWRIRELILVALPLGAVKLAYVMGVLALGRFRLDLGADAMRSLTLLTLVLAGQTTGLVPQGARDHVWRSRPAMVLLAATGAAAVLVSVFAWAGWFMTPMTDWLVLSLYGASLGYGLMLDAVKVAMLRRLSVDRR